jgi:hypothetical protein
MNERERDRRESIRRVFSSIQLSVRAKNTCRRSQVKRRQVLERCQLREWCLRAWRAGTILEKKNLVASGSYRNTAVS